MVAHHFMNRIACGLGIKLQTWRTYGAQISFMDCITTNTSRLRRSLHTSDMKNINNNENRTIITCASYRTNCDDS